MPLTASAGSSCSSTLRPSRVRIGPAAQVVISAISEGVRGYALDPANAAALWKKSEQLVGESFN